MLSAATTVARTRLNVTLYVCYMYNACLFFTSFDQPASPYCEECVCVCVCVCMCIHTHTHTFDCLETRAYELLLLPNNTASEIFLHKSWAMRSVDWVFITAEPTGLRLGEYGTRVKRRHARGWRGGCRWPLIAHGHALGLGQQQKPAAATDVFLYVNLSVRGSAKFGLHAGKFEFSI